MGISKPYYRIARPNAFIPDYVVDKRYASDRIQLSRAYINIEKELRSIFDYIEPDECNKNTFSFELYSILLRACTEVELNCKQIMEANGANASSMSDYKKLEKSSKLSKYKVYYSNWRQMNTETDELDYIVKELCPFKEFGESIAKEPCWYKAYNDVKHNREKNLKNANLENCMNAGAAILILLYSQFGSQCIETYGSSGVYFRDAGDYDLHFDADVIFEVKAPGIDDWHETDLYDFDWNKLKDTESPFEKFCFNN